MEKIVNKKSRFRDYLQYLCLSVFIFLIAIAVFPSKEPIPLDIFLRLDPLIAIGTSISTWEIIDKAFIATSIIILTFLFGRIFCGYICPMGTSIDLSENLFIKKPKRKQKEILERIDKFRKYRNIKYYLLIATLFSAMLGLTLLYIFDPISLITRTIAHFFYPLVIYLSNAVLDIIRPLASSFGFIGLSHKHYIQPIFGSNFVIFIMFLTIVFVSLYQSRFWCRYLCPLGALLGLCSKTAVIKRRVSEECNNCDLCKGRCPMGAIKEDPKEVSQSECIQCENCVRVCPQNAVEFKFTTPIGKGYSSPVSLSRRAVINSIGAGFALSFIAKTNIAKAQVRIIRPPGAIPEEEFLKRCVRCGECVKACITNTLQPTLFESGLEGLWTPRHNMRHAGCEQQCNMCGQVCPTQAIRSLPLEERKYARVGTAVIIRDRCLAWEQNRLCIICDEQCPYNALVFKNVGGHKRPFVDETKCNGCGICEEKCPIVGDKAIKVWPLGEVRLKEGSYIEEARRLKLVFEEEKDQWEDIGGEFSQPRPVPVESHKKGLPPGFIIE
jgi:MauM/NapG family ferredoxin protein